MEKAVLSVVLPCLNEAETIAECVTRALKAAGKLGLPAEVVVADNGSTDRSREIALERGARVVSVSLKGYGQAVRAGIREAAGEYIVMADADNSYDLSRLEDFYQPLLQGADLVIGDRFAGGISPGAMPFLHRYCGTPSLTLLTNLLFGTSIRDSQCGIRGFRKTAFLGWELSAGGMEFASEMNARAGLAGLRIVQVPAPYKKAGRLRPSHLRTFRDGFRHLFLLLNLYVRANNSSAARAPGPGR